MRKNYSNLYTLLIFMGINLAGIVHTYAEVPENISYQAVVRNSNGDLVSGSSVGVQVSIIENEPEGDILYVERHFPISNSNGLVSFEIGSGLLISGNYESIDWTKGLFFVKTEIDPQGGATYTITNTSQLLSVPFAKHASGADFLNFNDSKWTPSDVEGSNWLKSGSNIYYDGGKVFIGRSAEVTLNEYFGLRAPVSGTTYGGMYIDTESENGRPFYGYATDGTARAWSYYNHPDQSWRLYNGGERFIITQEGNVGFHTTTPTHDLTLRHRLVTSAATQSYGLKIENSGANNRFWHLYTQNNIEALYLYFMGNHVGTFSGATGAYSSVSDSRLKTDITSLDNVLDNLIKLEARRYRYTFQDEKSHRYALGFFADDVGKYFPELVYSGIDDAGNDIQTMDYSALSVVAVKAIQEQQVEIEELKKELDELRKVITQLIKE
jgi:hypothetical protein